MLRAFPVLIQTKRFPILTEVCLRPIGMHRADQEIPAMTETIVVFTASAGVWLEESDGACPDHGLGVPPRLRDSGSMDEPGPNSA